MMTGATKDGVDAVLAGVPVVSVTVESGTHVRRDDHSTVLGDGTPMPLQTDAPDSLVAITVAGGWWPWHLVCQHLRGLTGCPDGVLIDRIVDHRHLVTAPGGQMILQRVRRSA